MPVVIQGLKMTAIHLGLIEIGRLEMFLSLGGITFLTPVVNVLKKVIFVSQIKPVTNVGYLLSKVGCPNLAYQKSYIYHHRS